jgi:hypothetical protein
VLVFRAPRQRRNGRPYDAALDAVVGVCPGRQLVIDTHPHYYHRIIRSTHPPRVQSPALLDVLIDELRRQLTVPNDVREFRSFVLAKIGEFLDALEAYDRLIAAVSPRLILVCQNGFEKALFTAAKRHAVPLVEAQHGLINYAHPAYSYPRGVDYESCAFPTYFLAFADYWTERCHYPARRCLAVGNDDFFVERTAPEQPAADVLFISADIYHEMLLAKLTAAAARLPARRFKYKLHPNQQADLAKIRAELAHLPNVEVVDGNTAARASLASAGIVVVVQSTVAHEALQAGKRLCVIPILNYAIHSDLFGLPQVILTPSVDSLVEAIEAPPAAMPPAVFFNRFDAARVARLMRHIYDSGFADEREADAALAHASNQ